jgi:hypothetical protein
VLAARHLLEAVLMTADMAAQMRAVIAALQNTEPDVLEELFNGS